MGLGLLFSILFIIVLLAISAFFAGSETALTGASKARMHVFSGQGNMRAHMVLKIREHKERLIGALLLGNTLVNILASSLATSVFIKIFGPAGVVYATGVMTVFILVFSEVLPKTYAFYHADTAAMALAPAVRAVIAVLTPVTELVSWIVRFVLRLFGSDVTKVSVGGADIDALRGAIDLHRGPGHEVKHQRAMLRSILDLADVEVEKIVTHRKNLTMIDASQPMEKILDEVLEAPHTRIPLWLDKPDNIVGIIHVRALLKEIQARGWRIDQTNILSLATEPWFIPESTSLLDQLQAFRQRHEHFALVVDEYGSLTGVVTLEDILEEIVGDISDELDEAVPGVHKQANGTYLVEGAVTVRDLNREFEWKLPDEDYSTLAGLILHEAKMIPDAGQSFNFFGFRFDVVRRQRNQITQVRVTPPPGLQKTERRKAAR